ncbi:MAG TPA: adenylate/guanylate cyclase domain-containing protein [Actinomycetota bacterium]|nr:adenylate/guanylate cyclase domain-containing protein [Actinomycetota bacterium]
MPRRAGKRILAAVLFTDIVNSTTVAERLGDARWKELISRHHQIVRRELKRSRGRELDTAGDGFFASFAEPAAALRCACAATETVRELGVEIRTGIHFGECEQVAGKLGGLTVVVGARVMSLGGPGEVLVTGTTRELVGGAGFGFEDRGSHSLKGVAGEWQVFEVASVDGVPKARPLDPEESERRLGDIRAGRLRSRTGALIGAVVAAALGVVAFVTLGASDEEPSLERIPIDTVGSIDPDSGRIEDAIDVGSEPTAVVVGGDSAWIASLEKGTLSRFDLVEENQDHLSPEGHPAALAIDESGFLWILNGVEATLVRVDPEEVVADNRITLSTGTRDLAAGEGALWVTNAAERTLTRIDLITESMESLELAEIGEPDGVAVSEGAVWVAGSEGLAEIDPGSMEERATWPLRFPGGKVAAGEGSVWVTHESDDQVAKVDPATGLVAYLPVGNLPIDIAVGGGAIWVTNSLDGTVSSIDPATNDVRQIRVGGSPEGVAFGDGSVWVAVNAR